MTRQCRTIFERSGRYIKFLAWLKFGKASMGGFKRVTKSKQCLEASTTTPPRTADGLTAVSQRPNVDPSSEYSLLSSPKFSRSYKPCQFCLLARQCLEISGRPTQHNAHRFHSVCRTGFVSCRATARVHREQLVGWSQLVGGRS
jgi:hypothetical protein